MQLIVETETALEINMAAVENIQNNKTDDLKTFDILQDQKVNGNERDVDLNGDPKGDGSVEVISEIDDTSADVAMNISNNEVKLSETLMNENEGINEQSQNGINSSVQNDIMDIDKSEETLEEDYLEDDIISIVEEPRLEVPENVNIEKHDVIVKDEVADDKQELIKFEENAVVDVTKDEKEVKVETEPVPVQCVKDGELQTPIEENVSDHVMIESPKTCPIQGDKKELIKFEENAVVDVTKDEKEVKVETEPGPVLCLEDGELQTPIEENVSDHVMTESPKTCPIQGGKETHQISQEKEEVIDKTDSVNFQNESSTVLELNDNDKIDVIDESVNSHVLINEIIETESANTAQNTETVAIILKEKHSLACEINILSPTKESKEDDIQIVEESKSSGAVIEDENGHIDNVEETKEHSIQSKNILDIEIQKETENTRHIIDTLVSPSSETHDVDIVEDLNKVGDQDEHQTVSDKEVKETENIIEHQENINTEKTSETSKCDSDEQESNTNAINTHDETYIMDVEKITEDAVIAEDPTSSNKENTDVNCSSPVTATTVYTTDKPICKLSNTLDILSDDDEDLPQMTVEKAESPKADSPKLSKDANNKCIDLVDDDDIMVIDEDTDKTENKSPEDTEVNRETVVQTDKKIYLEHREKTGQETIDLFESHDKEETSTPSVGNKDLNMEIDIREKTPEPQIDNNQPLPPLIPDKFVKTAKKKLSDMTRDDLEEFCILKIVESIVDRSNLNDIQNKLKSMTQGFDEYKKKVKLLARQNRDLQLVLKSVQEEQKKGTDGTPIAPLKITRSVGMQVYMEKIPPRKKGQLPNCNNKSPNNTQNKNVMPLGQGIHPQKQVNQSQMIPVPRLVPASNPALKTPNTIPQINQMNTTPVKAINPPNGIKTPSPAMRAEKRQHNKVSSSMTVDLTDDEPPTKMAGGPKTSPAPPVRLVPPQNLMAPQRQPFATNVNSPRKVYIPISGPQSQALRPGQTIMLKTVPASGIRPRAPQVTRGEANAARMNRIAPRHPAPLPCATKQYQPPNWKSLPPAPDLKLSKVENGIVISWKIESSPEDSYEEIASYQLYAYQETSLPPSTSLWKKIGDVKALPLPMACTLTQFMAGFKYYFAVRAVDIRSRFGPFSLPGSILLLNKNI